MLKLKPGKVFNKINNMDRKQAYTIGGIVIVCFVALITLASFMGKADDASVDGFESRGYDLAQMGFATDAAEQYLLSSAYPDMQGNNASVLYSPQEREARQEQDALEAGENTDEEMTPYSRRTRGDDEDDSSSYGSSSGRGRGYSGRGSRGDGTGRTAVGTLNSASVNHASGSGISGTYGAPRGDFSPYRDQNKGEETPAKFKNSDARKALYQFSRGSQAAAGLRDAKGVNAKKALQGGNITGSEAFGDGAVDWSKIGGLAMDTNAPVTSSDLSNLGKDVAEAANKAEQDQKEEEKSFWEKMGEAAMEGLLNVALQGIGNMVDAGIDAMSDNWAGKREGREYLAGCVSNCSASAECAATCTNLTANNNDLHLNGNNQVVTKSGKIVSPRQAWRAVGRTDPGAVHAYNQGYNHSHENNLNVGGRNSQACANCKASCAGSSGTNCNTRCASYCN